jgi:2-oxoglutarate dehydrogenase E2 component (dihydrolipoamide succinyltransferase)
MEKIIIPNINNNEIDAILVEWVVEEGEKVKTGDIVAILETTKSTLDLEAASDGYVRRDGVVKKKYDFGSSIGWIYRTQEELEKSYSNNTESVSKEDNAVFITEPAKKLMAENGISIEKANSLGVKVVKAKDLEALISNTQTGELVELTSRQLGIAKTVLQSKNTIPAAFQIKKVYVTEALVNLGKFSAENKILSGIPELIIMSLSSLFSKFPYFFCSLVDEKNVKMAEAANIGVTFDVGKGLFIPVISDANLLSIRQVSEQMMVFRMKALRDNFTSKELVGSNISISLNMDNDTLLVQPIIFPGQSCMLSVGAIFKEVSMDDMNELKQIQYIQLGLAYDHRIINGYEANAFLTGLKKFIENADTSILASDK